MLLKECPNLKDVEIGHLTFESQNDIEIIKPIFDKVTKLNLSINESDINDEDLKGLLAINKQLEYFDVSNSNEKITANVLHALPCGTIRKLVLTVFEESILFLSDFHVSMHYNYTYVFFSFLILIVT